jgi:hypothetical protein
MRIVINRIFCILATWFGSCFVHAGELVTLYRSFPMEMRIDVYAEPILYTDDKFENRISGVTEPEWMRAFVNYRRPDAQSFKVWREGFAEAYFERNGITEDAHSKSSAMRKKQGPVQTRDISFFWTLWIKAKDRNFAFVASYQYGHISKIPEKRSDLQFALNIVPFEKIEGKWRMQVVDPVPEIRALPLGNLDALRKILEAKAAIIDGPSSARPIKITQ